MKIVMASDHSALDIRAEIKDYIESLGHEVWDLGPFTDESTDYPLYGAAAAKVVAQGEADLGVIFCGTGLGISLAANKMPGIRCCVCSEPYTAKMSRLHNDANMLAMGARVVGSELAKDIVDAFLNHEVEGGRHGRRVNLIKSLDKDPTSLDDRIEKILAKAKDAAKD